MERPRYIGSWLCESSFWYLPELSIREVTSTQSVCQVAQVCRKIFHSSFFLDNVNTKKRGGLLAFASTNRSILASCPKAWTSPYTTSNACFVCVAKRQRSSCAFLSAVFFGCVRSCWRYRPRPWPLWLSFVMRFQRFKAKYSRWGML
jgi:hypothetical protein